MYQSPNDVNWNQLMSTTTTQIQQHHGADPLNQSDLRCTTTTNPFSSGFVPPQETPFGVNDQQHASNETHRPAFSSTPADQLNPFADPNFRAQRVSESPSSAFGQEDDIISIALEAISATINSEEFSDDARQQQVASNSLEPNNNNKEIRKNLQQQQQQPIDQSYPLFGDQQQQASNLLPDLHAYQQTTQHNYETMTMPSCNDNPVSFFNDLNLAASDAAAVAHNGSAQTQQNNNMKQQQQQAKPSVEIVEQPSKCALRFRYKCEGRSAGSIPGTNSTADNKTYPSIRINNYTGRAVVVISCVDKDPPYRAHPHNIVGKEGCKRGICTIVIQQNDTTEVRSFTSLGIQCVKRKDIEESLSLRQSINVDPFRNGFAHKLNGSNIDLNVVRLCFQVFIEGSTPNQCDVPLTPVVSDQIYDKKAMSDLVITKLSHCSAPATGGREIILLCDRIAKDDIQVRFYEERGGELVWETHCEIAPNEVHKQVAICFKTPKYYDENIAQPVMARIQLKRTSDQQVSEPRLFQFLPCESDEDIILRKRQKIEWVNMNHYALDNIFQPGNQFHDHPHQLSAPHQPLQQQQQQQQHHHHQHHYLDHNQHLGLVQQLSQPQPHQHQSTSRQQQHHHLKQQPQQQQQQHNQRHAQIHLTRSSPSQATAVASPKQLCNPAAAASSASHQHNMGHLSSSPSPTLTIKSRVSPITPGTSPASPLLHNVRHQIPISNQNMAIDEQDCPGGSSARPSDSVNQQLNRYMIDTQGVVVRREIINDEGRSLRLVERTPSAMDSQQQTNDMEQGNKQRLDSSLDRLNTKELVHGIGAFNPSMDLNLGTNLSIHLGDTANSIIQQQLGESTLQQFNVAAARLDDGEKIVQASIINTIVSKNHDHDDPNCDTRSHR